MFLDESLQNKIVDIEIVILYVLDFMFLEKEIGNKIPKWITENVPWI